MSLSWFKKQMLKVNPKAIEGIFFRNLDDEAVSFAIEHGYLRSDLEFKPQFLRYSSYVKKCLEIGSPFILNRLRDDYVYYLIPPQMIPQVVQKLIDDSDFKLYGTTNEAYILQTNPDLWLKTVEMNHSFNHFLYPISRLDIPELKKGEFFTRLIETGIPISELSQQNIDNEEVFNAYLDKDPENVYKVVAGFYSPEKYIERCKEHLLSNIDRNLPQLRAFKKSFDKFNTCFVVSETERIVRSAVEHGYILSPDDYTFLFGNEDLVYQTVMSLEGKLPEDIMKAIQTGGGLRGMTERQHMDIGHKLYELNYDFKKKDDWAVYNFGILRALIDENPYIVDGLNLLSSYELDYVFEKIDESDYVITRDSRYYMFEKNVNKFYESLENNFEETVQNPEAYRSRLIIDVLAMHKRVYEICKENGYTLAEDAPEVLRKNPFLVRDALRAGAIPKSNILSIIDNVDNIGEVALDIARELKKIPDFHPPRLPEQVHYYTEYKLREERKVGRDILLPNSPSDVIRNNMAKTIESARKYFPSIKNFASTWEITQDEQKEISRLFFEYIDSHPGEIQKDWESISLLRLNPYICMEQIKRGDRPVFRDAIYQMDFGMIDELDRIEKPAQRRKIVLPERVVKLREILAENLSPEDLGLRLRTAGIEPIVQEQDPEDLKSNPSLVMFALSQDFSLVNQVSKILELNKEQRDWVIARALEENYEVKEDSLYFIRNSKEIAMQAAKRNPEELQYFYGDIEFDEKEQDEIFDVLTQRENPIILNDSSFDFLRTSERYILFSIEHSDAKTLESVIDGISLDDVPLNIQKVIYDKYANNRAELENTMLPSKLESNVYYMRDYLLKNLGRIDEIDMTGKYIPVEFKEEIGRALLDSDYRITENTPRYLMQTREFIAEYILRHPERLEEVGKKRVISLITRENCGLSENVRKLAEILPEGIKTPISIYEKTWGRERAHEILKNFGDATKYLSRDTEYTVEEARNELIGVFKRGGVTRESDAISLISGLNIELTEEDFANLGNIRRSTKLFDRLVETQPEYVKFYQGSETRIFEKAIANGLFDGKTEEEIDGILIGETAKSRAVMEYLLDHNLGKFITRYAGSDSAVLVKALKNNVFDDIEKEEIDKFILNSQMASLNRDLFTYLIKEKSPDYVLRYQGFDRKVYGEAINLGAFDGKSEEELAEILKVANISRQTDVMMYLMEQYSPDIIERYTGMDEEVFKKALEVGYEPSIEKVALNSRLLASSSIFSTVVSKTPEAVALKFNMMAESQIEEELDSLYDENFLTDQKKHVFSGLCRILNRESNSGLKLLKAFNPELVDTLGLDNWRTLIRYSIRQPNLQTLVEITEAGNLANFIETYKAISPMIVDDVALGINKFLNIANFYKVQPELCKQLLSSTKDSKELSDISKINLQTLIYNAENHSERALSLNDLENLVGSEKQSFTERLDTANDYTIKSDLVKYLFNMDFFDASNLLSHDINSKVVSEILNGAKKSKNQSLQLEAEYMSVLVDTLEQIYYFNGKEEDLKAFARNIYSLEEQEVFKIRKEFVHINETIRKFYEHDAQEELTDIKALAQDEKYYTYYQKDEETQPVKVIDISNMKHTVYCHALGTTVDAMFDRDEGRPTICVSPETDMHEAFYGQEKGIILVFSEIPKGSFIGSAPANMGSNNTIQNNDYKIDGVLSKLKQMGIRQSHEEDGHAETLLYRAGLIPTGVKMVGNEPSQEEIQAVRDLERKIFEVTGKKVEIPIIKTQHEKNRVVRYQGNITEEKELEDYTEKAKQVQALRREFFGIIDVPKSDGVIVRSDYDKEKYTIIDGEVYTLNSDEWNMEYANEKVARSLEQIVYGEDSDKVIDIIRVQGEDGVSYDAKKQSLARNMWKHDRTKGGFLPEVNSVMLSEFLVDHLMCNYASDNESFILDEENNARPATKSGAFRKKEDFVTVDGKPYTAMSYLYYDSKNESNLYRRSFENYIYNPNAEEILNDSELDEFVAKAEEISKMDEAQYLEIFEPILLHQTDYADRMKIKEMILARKENAGKDAKEFAQRLKALRQIEQKPDVIQSVQDIAFINDIHGNLPAVQSIIEDCKKNGKKTIYVLGDMIGFGPQSNECLDALREASKDIEIKCILGNHEMYSLMGNQNFEQSYGFDAFLTNITRNGLSAENRAFLEGLPISRKLIVEGKKIELTHFPARPNYKRDQDIYLGHNAELTESKSGLDQEYLIYGHEHRTELTTGNDVGTVLVTQNQGTTYMNLPSSGCVHGKNTSYVSLVMRDGKLEPEVKSIEYDKKQIEEAVWRTNNPKGHFFGVGGQDGR